LDNILLNNIVLKMHY